MESIFNVKKILQILRKRLPLIVAMTLLFIVLSGVASYTIMTPTYQASTQILVNQNRPAAEGFDSQSIEANIQLIGTYNVMIKSPVILEKVIDELNLNETVKSLEEKMTVSAVENTQVLTLDVEDKSMQRAVLIANTTATTFQQEVSNLMKVDNVSIWTDAEMPLNPEPIKPDPILNMAIGGILGLLFGTGLSLLLYQLNTTIRSEEDVEEIIGLQVLGIVSPVDSKEMKNTSNKHAKKELDANVEVEKVQTVSSTKIGGSF
jgi:capsular polysaccharide biosynthesis protein